MYENKIKYSTNIDRVVNLTTGRINPSNRTTIIPYRNIEENRLIPQ